MDFLIDYVQEKHIINIINEYKNYIDTHIKYIKVKNDYNKNIKIINKYDKLNECNVTIIINKKYKKKSLSYEYRTNIIKYNIIRYNYINSNDRLRINLYYDQKQVLNINANIYNLELNDFFIYNNVYSYFTTIKESNKYYLTYDCNEKINL